MQCRVCGLMRSVSRDRGVCCVWCEERARVRRARRAVDAGCLALFVAGLVMIAVAAWLM